MSNPIEQYFNMKKTSAKKESNSAEVLNYYVSFIRSLYTIYQNSHWKCKGIAFYGNHELFKRLYEEAQDVADEAAEKLIGIFGNDSLDLTKQNTSMSEILSKYSSNEILKNALAATEEFLILSKETYKSIESNGDMSLGLDDMIMSHSSKIETAVYLLKQAIDK